MKDAAAKKAEEVKGDVKHAANVVGQKMEDAKDAVADKAQEVKHDAQHAAHIAGQKVDEVKDAADRKSKEMAQGAISKFNCRFFGMNTENIN